jgi:hypothetical protein
MLNDGWWAEIWHGSLGILGRRISVQPVLYILSRCILQSNIGLPCWDVGNRPESPRTQTRALGAAKGGKRACWRVGQMRSWVRTNGREGCGRRVSQERWFTTVGLLCPTPDRAHRKCTAVTGLVPDVPPLEGPGGAQSPPAIRGTWLSKRKDQCLIAWINTTKEAVYSLQYARVSKRDIKKGKGDTAGATAVPVGVPATSRGS